jgi:hypothetical protein
MVTLYVQYQVVHICLVRSASTTTIHYRYQHSLAFNETRDYSILLNSESETLRTKPLWHHFLPASAAINTGF